MTKSASIKKRPAGSNSSSSKRSKKILPKQKTNLHSFFSAAKSTKPKASTPTAGDPPSPQTENDTNKPTITAKRVAPILKKQKLPPSKKVAKGDGGVRIVVSPLQRTEKAIPTYIKTPYTDGDHLPVITKPQEMFDDMVKKRLKNGPFGPSKETTQLKALLQKLGNRPLRLATMCSGTESPLLALDMLQKSIQDAVKERPDLIGESAAKDHRAVGAIFQLEHVFSCEIEPFKQAYIERNFHPPLLFRDIRELGDDMAYTAYGAHVPVPNQPGCVDMLIAGTSCVDYSNLNNKKKEIDDGGESGSTFFGMLEWIRKAQPPIVILENVFGAPWEKKCKIFRGMGYTADYLRLDTKDYYIPHTRQRGYLFAVRKKSSSSSSSKTDMRADEWKKLVANCGRNASATLDAYLLPHDDPRVLRGRAQLTAEASDGDGNRAGRTDWTKCETRHLAARSNEELGEKRPLTGWSESGKTTLPGRFWTEWFDSQVNRIHDLTDINTLRLATDGVDPTYKTMVWNLSQNVDRDTMGRLGLCQCLTPTGVPFLTNRGGPIVGEELLMLQGIPADDLLFTKETEDNLKDLAGNAMSTTVVGVCSLAALLVGHASLACGLNNSPTFGAIVPSLVPRAILPLSNDISICKSLGDYQQQTVNLSPNPINNVSDWSEFLKAASSSARKCVSEGVDECISVDKLLQCKECGHTSSISNALPPRKFEEHEFAPMDDPAPRVEPSVFRQKLLNSLPMRATLAGFKVDSLHRPNGIDETLWKKWIEAFNTVTDGDGIPSVFSLAAIVRTRIWTAVYYNREGGRLEARVSDSGITWLLFAKAPTKLGVVKDALENPLARMVVDVKPLDFSGQISLLDGVWQFYLPMIQNVQLSIEGIGGRVPSWRNRLGLKGKYEKETQHSTLRMTIMESALEGSCSEVKHVVDGDYQLLRKCGGNCGMLMKKTSGLSDDPMFFFLDSGRKALPNDDTCVFASSFHRTAFGEYREIALKIDPSQVYRPLQQDGCVGSEGYKVNVRAHIPGRWSTEDGASLISFDVNDANIMSTSRAMSIHAPMSNGSWKRCPELLSCTFQVSPKDDLFLGCQDANGAVELNLQKSKKTLSSIFFATSRLRIPEVFIDTWLELKYKDHLDEGDLKCPTCAPKKPDTKWTVITKGKKAFLQPIEDGVEGAAYERAMKSRPQPWMIQLRAVEHTTPSLSLSIGCNAFSLVQQALSLFPTDSMARKFMIAEGKSNMCSFDWRVVSHVDEMALSQFKKLTFSSNRHDQQAEQPPNFDRYPLRKEQLRSLTWMLKQEASNEPYYEEEVSEAVLPSFNWRAEGRVKRPVLVRGGIVADEVGYGKTAITLGLIDSSTKDLDAPPDSLKDRFIPTKATLVVVPKHLMGQWPAEIKKFLGATKTVLVLKDLASLNSTSVEDVQKADIVVVSFAALGNEKYFRRLARLSGSAPTSFPSGTSGGRHFVAVYQETLNLLKGRVQQILHDCPSVSKSIDEDAKSHSDSAKAGSLRLDGKKAVYKQGASASIVAASNYNSQKQTGDSQTEKDPWHLRDSNVKRDYSKMKSPPLEMFYWNRVVVDEFTYLTIKDERDRCLSVIRELKSKHRWLLSGTPQHSNFDDIKSLASLLGIHLGVEEDLPGMKVSRTESTGLENLSSFMESRSIQWHRRRHAIGQEFLDRFVRQNIAEIDEIAFEEKEIIVPLALVERCRYLELSCHLESLDMNSKSAQKSKRKSTGDRESRMQKVLEGSKSGEEALLKCSSYFDSSSGMNGGDSLQTIDGIINIRMAEKIELEKEMENWLIASFQQRERILNIQPSWSKVTENAKGELLDALRIFLREVENCASVPQGADDEVNQRIQEIVDIAEKKSTQGPLQNDPFFRQEDGENEEDEDDDDTGKGASAAKKKEKADLHLFSMKQALRNHMHGIRSLSKELCGRMRSLRYIQQIRKCQEDKKGMTCSSCKKKHPSSSFGLLSCCGHAACLGCLRKAVDEQHCVVLNCSARPGVSHIVTADNFAGKEEAPPGRFGRKMAALTEKVKQLQSQGDRTIVFCQFDDLMEKVKEALNSGGIKAVEVRGTVTQQINTISVFQKDNPSKDDPHVLLLKLDDEQSAGLNLTNLNHAIFVHPLLADSQDEYDAYETQAIGRIHRYGQKKTVHVWRYLAADTIDTVIFSERNNRREITTPMQ